eukprot:scaffold9726_cov119-Isochrysis_galbana.AAC.18
MAKNLYLAQCTLRVCQVLECLGNLLDGYLLSRGIVNRGTHNAVRAVAEWLDQSVARIDVKARAAHHETVDAAVRLAGHPAVGWRRHCSRFVANGYTSTDLFV